MSKVIIECPDNFIANAIALWFESGEAIETFKKTSFHGSAIDCGAVDIGEYPGVEFEEDTSFPEHTVTIEEE
jgi:hypothetical protein